MIYTEALTTHQRIQPCLAITLQGSQQQSSGHTKAFLMDGARALKPCQTNFHIPARDHELQLAKEQGNNFLFKAQILREKGLSPSEEVSPPTGTNAR